jgi:transposase
VVLANAYKVKSTPGRVTDTTSAQWLAQLLRSGFVKPSYVPERGIRDLRELTRFRFLSLFKPEPILRIGATRFLRGLT